MAERDGRRDGDAIRITTAAPSRLLDTAARQRRYLWSMALRTGCVVGAAVVATVSSTGWAFWLLVAGAVVLPYVAVVAANAVAKRTEDPDLPTVTAERLRLAGRDTPPQEPRPPWS